MLWYLIESCLGKHRDQKERDEKMALKKRVVECLEKRQRTENPTPVKNAVDMALEGFTLMITAYLRKLPLIARLQAQQDMLRTVSEALQLEEAQQSLE